MRKQAMLESATRWWWSHTRIRLPRADSAQPWSQATLHPKHERWFTALLVACCAAALSLPASACDIDPYARLRQAYHDVDARLAASAYSDDAQYIELYVGAPPMLKRGTAAIREHFDGLFRLLGLDPTRRADLNFRVTTSVQTGDARSELGYYSLSVRGDKEERYYGRFAVTIKHCLFTSDTSADAQAAEFAQAKGPLMFEPDPP